MTETSAVNLLVPPTPRAVTRRVFWRSWAEAPVQVWWKCALVALAVMTYVTVLQVRAYLRNKDLLEHGLPVKARIVELSDRKLGTGRFRPERDVELFIKLEGVMPDGRDFHYEGMLPKADGFAELGATMDLRVDPNDSSRWVEVGPALQLAHQFMAVFLLCPVVLVLLAIAQWRRMGVVKIWREGRVCEGIVVGCKHSAMAPRSHVCRYTVPDTFEKRVFQMLYPTRHGILREGDLVQMIVLPDRPGYAIMADLYVRPVEG